MSLQTSLRLGGALHRAAVAHRAHMVPAEGLCPAGGGSEAGGLCQGGVAEGRHQTWMALQPSASVCMTRGLMEARHFQKGACAGQAGQQARQRAACAACRLPGRGRASSTGVLLRGQQHQCHSTAIRTLS